MGNLTLTLLGGFQARIASGASLAVGKKAQGMLAVLAVPLGQSHPRDKLATLLWGGMGEEHGRHSVRQSMFALRKALSDNGGERLFITSGEGIALNPDSVDIDVVTFERLASENTMQALEQAAALYRGDLLEGLRLREPAFGAWLSAERERLRTRAVTGLQRLMDLYVSAGRLDRAVETGQRVLGLDPAREAMHRALIRLYLQSDRRAAALKQYRTCEAVLARELGVKPDAETRELYNRIVDTRAAAPSGEEAPSAGGGNILVVEDEPVTRAVLEGYLTIGGYNVVAVADGGDALLQLSRRAFDLILSDIAMPTLDGLKLLEVLARNAVDTPVIFLTGQLDETLEARGLELGAVDYMRKPVQKEVLLLRVQRALRTPPP